MRNWLKVFFLYFIFGLLVYFNSLNNKFMMDDYYFLNNPVLSSAKYMSSQWNPFHEQALGVLDAHENLGYYRPMAHMELDLCYAVFKKNLWQYHFFNLFLFVFASSLIYLFIEKVTGNFNFALLTGLFYLIHPINGIVVNYISASVFAFQVIFMLGAVLLLLESLERKNDPALYILSLVFSFLSLFWNESGIMIPFYISAFVLLLRKNTFKEKALYLFPYFLIIFSYIIFRFFFISINDIILKQVARFHMTLGEYLAALFQIFTWYIGKLFYPQGIVMQWVMPVLHGHIMGRAFGAFLLLLFFIFLFIRFAKEKILQMAVIWIAIGFAPVCLAAFKVPEIGVQIEPHWFIFSCIGFFILAAYFCSVLLNRSAKAGLVLLFILIFSWVTVSRAYNFLWADQKTYVLYWSQQVPGLKMVYFFLGDSYRREGALKEAKKYYREALSGGARDIDIYNNLGDIDYTEGDLKEAELNYKRSIKCYPYSAYPYNNLGMLYLNMGQLEKADKFFHQALSYNPLLLEPRRGIATIFLKQSDYQKAIDLCLINLNIVKDDTDTLFLLIDIYFQKGDLVSMKKTAYRIINNETDPKALIKLGIVMEMHHEPVIALDCFIKVIQLAPDYNDAYLEAGELLSNMGKYNDAIHIWKIGLSIDPSDQRFKRDIIKIEKLKSK